MWFKKDKKAGRNVYMLLDRSGSMSTNWVETIGSINSYVEKLESDVNVYLAVFDSAGNTGIDYEVIRETTSGNWKPVLISELSARGSTPLYDAVGKICDRMLNDNAERAVLVIMTDGYENASREYSLSSVKAKLKEMEQKDWPTVFLGADFKDVTNYTTSTFNINTSNVVNTTAATRGIALGMMADKTTEYFNATANSTASFASMKWSDAEKAQVEGSSSHNPKTKLTSTTTSTVIPISQTTGDTSGHA